MRRIFIIAAVVIVLLGIGGFVWWRYFSSTPGLAVSQTPTPTSLPASGAAPSTTVAGAAPSALAVTKVTARLTKIALGPIVPGEVAVDLPAANASSSPDVNIEFIERQSGNIFSYLAHAGTLTRTSNKTLPGIEKAAWLPSGQTAFVTYLSGDSLSIINTYGLAFDGSGGFFLPQGLADIAVSSTSVLMLASGITGSVASLTHTDGTKSATVWSSPLSELRIGFAGNKGSIAFTKPAQGLDGDLFFVSPGGGFTRIVGPVSGLSALANHSGSTALVSAASSGVMRLALVDTSSGAETSLPVATIADKCVWTADDSAIYCGVPVAPSTSYSYPDDWYQGAARFSDRIWKIDVKGRFAQLVLDPATTTMGPLDAEALALDPKATTLVFVNKNDGSLWSYGL